MLISRLKMASEHNSRSSPYTSKKHHEKSYNSENNGHPTLTHRLSRAEYDELRSNGTTNGGSSKISEPSSVIEGTSGQDDMPNEEEIEKRFGNLLEKLTLDPDQVMDLQQHPIQHKWKLIQAKEMVEPKHSSQFYVSQLRRHMDEALLQHAKPPKKLIKDLEPIEVILRSLEVDVRTHPNTTWLREFLDEPYNGHQVLINFLGFLQKNPPPPQQQLEQKSSQKKSKSSKRRRRVMARSHADEHMCLMCVKALMKNKFAFKSVMAVDETLTYIVMCLQIDNIKTKILAIKLLYAACANDKYHSEVIEAMEYFRAKAKEHQMFGTLVGFLFQEPVQPGLQAVTLALLNAIVNSSPSYNERIFHQQQICVAGFSDQHLEKILDGLDAAPVRDELKIWRENFVNIQDLMDEYMQLKERSQLLRDEVDLLQGKLEDVQREKNEVERQKTEFEQKAEDFRFRATELQTALEKIVKTQNKDGIDASLLEILNSTSNPAPPPGPPPPPPPAPPPFPGCGVPAPPPPPPGMKAGLPAASGLSKRKVVSKKKLPMLNWAPVTNTKKTIFESMDDEKLALQLDLTGFESMFELKRNEMSEEVRLRKEAALKKLAEQITVIESNRARNLVIAKRRIGFTPKLIQRYINHTDLSELCPEHAELLLKFVPTKEELAGLAKHTDDYAKLAEAEQFMFEMAKVKRYEAKLGVLTFIGVFDEVMSTVVPKVDVVTRASLSILNNKKLKKIFEIILAFGNYMNGERRRVAAGFKLESLYKLHDIRSTDRKTSLLNYVVQTVKTHFPELRSFADELCLQDATQVSKQTLNADIQSLKKGIDLTKTERDKQPGNFVLFSFYNRAFRKVQKVTEKYRKMDETYTDVCQMFGEDGKKIEPSEFFKILHDFVSTYFQAEKENDERKRQEEAQRQAELMMSQQRNKEENEPSVEKAWSYTKDSPEYGDEEEDYSTSGSDGSDST